MGQVRHGCASGCLTFYMEGEGVDVVSFDLSEQFDWDLVPFFGNDGHAARLARRNHLRKINSSYWLCPRSFGSSAKMVHGVVYDIPVSIGQVDVAVLGSILLHVRDPFPALENAARLTREAIIVADVSPYGQYGQILSRFRKSPRFMPRSLRPNGVNDGWFKLPPLLVQEYLGILGFQKFELTWNQFEYGLRKRPVYTIVAHR